MKVEGIFGAVVLVVVASAIGLAFQVTGSPSHQRAIAIDTTRTALLADVSNDIRNRYRGTGERLPGVLPSNVNAVDPVTKKPFDYRRTDATHYRLCATFALASEPRDRNPPTLADDWSHAAGHVCFGRDLREY